LPSTSFGLLELLQELAELPGVPQVDVRHLVDPVLPVLVVGQVVVPLEDADVVERPVAGRRGRSSATRPGSNQFGKGQEQHVEHELDVLGVVGSGCRPASRRPGL